MPSSQALISDLQALVPGGQALVTKMRRIFIVLLICMTACRTTAAHPEPSSVVSAFLTAFNALDTEALRALLADDATAFLPFASTGARLDGRDAIVRAIEPLFSAERARGSHLNLTAKDVTAQRLGDDGAVVSFDVGNEHVHSRRTLVLRFDGGRWVIVHLHASNVRPE